jgi:hypothetical protein
MPQLNGQLFIDLNGNGSIDTSSGDTGTGIGWTVFIDANGNGIFDTGELSDTTDASGNYSITGISIGTYNIGVLDNSGPTPLTTFPGAANDYYLSLPLGSVTFTRGIVERTINFENSQTHSLSDNLAITAARQPWVRDGFRFWTDNNNNNRLDSRESSTATLFLEKTNISTTDSAFGFVNDFASGPFGAGRKLIYDREQTSEAGELGTFFLRGGGLYTSTTIPTFLMEYATQLDPLNPAVVPTPAVSGSGTIWDIDTTWTEFTQGLSEQWKVEFLSATDTNNDGLLENINVLGFLDSPKGLPVWVPKAEVSAYTSRGGSLSDLVDINPSSTWFYNTKSLDAKDWEWSFDRQGADVNFVRISFIGQKTLNSDVGFAFDNFKTYAEDIETKNIGVFEPATIGDKVWVDSDGDGIQDTGEAGVAGVTVELLDENGNSFSTPITTTTDANGKYSFNVAPGTYSVKFSNPSTTLYTGFTLADQGTDDVDSDANSSGLTNSVTVESGEINNTLDAGLVPKPPEVLPVSIGNFVWEDSNGNGIQDSGEPGISEVTVEVFSGSTPVQTLITDGNGAYNFSNLPGTYTVVVTAPGGYTATATGKGTTATDSNFNGSSTTLNSGQGDDTIDFGFYKPASIGNFVWLDSNADGKQTTGENGINNVTVKLLDSNQEWITSGVTDAEGFYQFTNLAPGTYYVEFIEPAGVNGFTTANVGDNNFDNIDSDAIFPPGTAGPVVLTSGQYNDTIDAGFLAPPPPPTQYLIGDKVWSDTNQDGLQDTGEAGIGGITVRLLDSTGTSVLHTTTTDSLGFYSFTVNNGTYVVEFAPSTTAYGFTQANIVGDNVTINYDDIDSDADVLTGRTATVTVNGADNLTVDAGLYIRPGTPEGFTIGYWRNNGLPVRPNGQPGQNQWAPTGYIPDGTNATTYESAFGYDFANVSNSLTMLQALNLGGNTASENLLRQSTAALLNASHPLVDYYYSIGEVLSLTKAALLTPGTSDDNALATQFDTWNNRESFSNIFA